MDSKPSRRAHLRASSRPLFPRPLPAATLLALLWALSPALPAAADPIGGDPSPCVTCLGSLYELTYTGSPIATTATTETWRITLTVDTSQYFGVDGNGPGDPVNRFIQGVAVSVSDTILAGSLVSAPGGLGPWDDSVGDLGNLGCTGVGNGFFCADVGATDFTLVPAIAAVYEWVFDLEIPTGDLRTDPLEAAIKANYINTLGAFRGQTNETITLQLVPEASVLGQTLLGLVVLAARRRRSR